MRQIDRLHYMDSLRATAMFLGLVLHALCWFCEWPNWHDRNHFEPSVFLHYLAELIHVFRMELFFLVAGFFSLMVCQKRGNISYIKNRFTRILIPFIICVLILQPWAAASALLNVSYSNVSFFDQYLKFLFDPSYILKDGAPHGNWFWHFWFLHLLIYFISVFVIARIVICKLKLKFIFVSKFLLLLRSKFSVFILVILTYPILLFCPPWADVPTIGTSIDVLLYYGLFFFFGVLFFTDIKIFDHFQKNIKYHIIPFILALFIFIPMVDQLRVSMPPEVLLQSWMLFTGVDSQASLIGDYPFLQNPFNFSSINAPINWHLMCLLRAYTTWCGIILFIVLFKKFLFKPSPLARYAADSSYFIYLIHFPIQISLSIYLKDKFDSAILCFGLCLIISLLCCLFLYHFTCRATLIGTLLSGRRYSLNVNEEWDHLKSILTRKSSYFFVFILMGIFFVADIFESKNEKRLLHYSLCAEEQNLKEYIVDKSPEFLSKVRRFDGRNALHLASSNMIVPRPDHKIENCLRLLLDGGIDPMSVDDFGQTPLHYSVRYDNKVALNILINAGADPNKPDLKYGNSPLHLAATLGSNEIITLLVEAGANPEASRVNGETSKQIYERLHSKSFPKY